MTPARRLASSILGVLIGAVALVLVTALLTAGVSSLRADHRTAGLSAQLKDANDQLTALRADNDVFRAQVRFLRKQNREQHRQINILFRYLRKNGLTIPSTALAQSSGPPTSAPKARTPSGASTPKHHGTGGGTPTPSPSTGPGVLDPGMLCDLLHLTPCPLHRR